jgi:glycosyltransferase involved in cell wall biosynthesis
VKVLFVFDNHELSGADKAAVNLLRHAAQGGPFEARAVVCMDNKLDGIQVSIPAAQLSPAQPSNESFLRRVTRGVRSLPGLARHCEWADIVIPVSPPAALWAGMAGAWARKPVAPWVHYDLDGLAREGLHAGRRLRDWLMLALYKHLVPSFRRLIFVSERTRASFSRERSANPSWIVLPNVYDRAGFSAQPSSSAAALAALRQQNVPLLLVLGRIFRQKRWEDAIAAAEALHQRGRRFNLAFVGDGVELDRLRERVAASPARAALHILGADPNASPALPLADALVMTSLYEAWPLVILEGFDLGVPVFAYDCPSGPAQMLGRARERGILVDESPRAMADALESWFWQTPPEERERTTRELAAAGKAFLHAHQPQNALAAWASGLARLIN